MTARIPDRRSSLAGVSLRSLSILCGLLLGGCLPSHHTPEPWRSDPVAGAALSLRAAEACHQSGANGGIAPVRPFVTDGCSLFPDTDWNLACCVEHDIAYWCGGDREARRQADAALGRCVADRSNAFLGELMRWGVRIGGQPVFPTPFRWGYGHSYRARYPSAVPRAGR